MPKTPKFGPSQPPDASDIEITSGVSNQSGGGFVHLSWGDRSGQLTPAEAREHGLSVIAAADAAEHDSIVVAVMRRVITNDGEDDDDVRADRMVGQFLLDLREERERRSANG